MYLRYNTKVTNYKRRQLTSYMNALNRLKLHTNSLHRLNDSDINGTPSIKLVYKEEKLLPGLFVILSNQNISKDIIHLYENDNFIQIESPRFQNMIKTLPTVSSKQSSNIAGRISNSSLINYIINNPFVIKLSTLSNKSADKDSKKQKIYSLRKSYNLYSKV